MQYSLYNGEVKLDFDEGKHLYRVDGQVVPGVTGICDVINKPALVGWAAKQCGLFIEKNLKPGKALDEIQIKQLVGDMKREYRRVAGEAADIGTLVHSWVEKHIKAQLKLGEPPEMPVNEQAQRSIEAFTDWEVWHHVQYRASEVKVYSRKYKYAGTVDIDAVIDGVPCIADLKTGNGIWPEMALQLAGYQQARTEEGYGPYKARWILRIGKDGIFEGKRYTNFKADLRGFIAARNLLDWLKSNKNGD